MGWYILEGIIVAIIAAFVSKNWAALISAAVMVPIIFWVIIAVTQMNANPANAPEIANSTISQITTYFGDHLPGIIISDVAGTLTGAVIGLFVLKE